MGKTILKTIERNEIRLHVKGAIHAACLSLCVLAGSVATAAGMPLLDIDKSSGTIGGTVWFDQNADGVQAGIREVGIPNVTVRLYRDDNGNGPDPDSGPVLVATATTGSNGGYVFGGLAAAMIDGGYYVEVSDENNVLGSAILTGGADPTLLIALKSGQIVLTANFGYYLDDFTPLAATLSYFTVQPNAAGDRLVLAWETQVELNTVGFDVHRWEDGTRGEKVETVMTMAKGSDMFGATYELLDPLPYGAGDERAYLLVETQLYGTTQTHGPYWSTKEAVAETGIMDWIHLQ